MISYTQLLTIYPQSFQIKFPPILSYKIYFNTISSNSIPYISNNYIKFNSFNGFQFHSIWFSFNHILNHFLSKLPKIALKRSRIRYGVKCSKYVQQDFRHIYWQNSGYILGTQFSKNSRKWKWWKVVEGIWKRMTGLYRADFQHICRKSGLRKLQINSFRLLTFWRKFTRQIYRLFQNRFSYSISSVFCQVLSQIFSL